MSWFEEVSEKLVAFAADKLNPTHRRRPLAQPNRPIQGSTTILGFLWMGEEQLGFDSTVVTADDKRFIEIERNDLTERLIIDEVMTRAPCVAGRATTCWKAHRDEDQQTPLVIKNSWQYLERDEEGEMLRYLTDSGVVNMARYYCHETVLVRGKGDDIRSNVRKGLDIRTAANYRQEPAIRRQPLLELMITTC